jgi:hypothetical protein
MNHDPRAQGINSNAAPPVRNGPRSKRMLPKARAANAVWSERAHRRAMGPGPFLRRSRLGGGDAAQYRRATHRPRLCHGCWPVRMPRMTTHARPAQIDTLTACNRIANYSPNKLRYLVKNSAADVPEFCSDLSQFIDSKAARSGAFLDLEGAASDLSERAGRPLLRVDVGAHIGERRIRRLTMVVRPSLQLV